MTTEKTGDNMASNISVNKHELDGLKETLFARLDAIEKAAALFQENLTRVPTDVDKQVGQLKNLLETRLDGMDRAVALNQETLFLIPANIEKQLSQLKEIIETRLKGMDLAVNLLHEQMTTVPSEAETQVSHLRELCEEKFDSITIQFKERDTRTEQTSKDSKVAVDAALQAAKEAVGEQNKSSALAIAKSEAATTKQIDQIGAMITAINSGTSDKIDDIKERLTSMEGSDKGKGDIWGMVIGGIGILIAIGAIVVAVMQRHP